MSTSIPKPPEILDKIVDMVLAHKPKNKPKIVKTKKATKKNTALIKSSR